MDYSGGGDDALSSAEGYLNVRFSTDIGAFGNLVHTLKKEIPFGVPTGHTFPYGLFYFKVTQVNAGSTIKVTVTFPDKIPAGSECWKYQGGKWIDRTSLISDNDGDNLLILTLTKGATTLKLVIGSKILNKNGIGSQADDSPETTPPGRTMLPARR